MGKSKKGLRKRGIDVISNVPERNKAKEKINYQATFLKKIINSLKFPFYVIDLDYKIIQANETAKKKGINIGCYCYKKTHMRNKPCEGKHACPLKDVLRLKKPVQVEHIHFDKNGNSYPVELYGIPIFGNHGEVTSMIEYSIDISGRKKVEEAREKILHDVNERIKELNCFFSLSKLIERPGISLAEILQGTVGLLPPGYQYSDITCARIVFENKEFKTENFKITKWKQSVGIKVHGKKAGYVEVYYLQDKPRDYEGPFLKEERRLITAIAERLGKIAERKEAEEQLKEMSSSNLSTLFIRDTLLKAKRAFIGDDTSYLRASMEKEESGLKKAYLESLLKTAQETPPPEIEKLNYSEVFRLTQLVNFKKGQAYRIVDIISLVEEKEAQYKKNGMDTSEGLTLLEEAKISFEEERYDESEAYLKEADSKLDKSSSESKRIEGLTELSKNLFRRYWWQIILTVIILVIIVPPIRKRVEVSLARKKLAALNSELQTITKLFRKAQEDCFRDKKITEGTYRIRAERYRSRTTEIKHTIPVLESIIAGKEKGAKKEPEERRGILEIKR